MTTYIVSFDIGIKNMAYCVFDASGSVVDWNISNLMDREPDAKTCTVLVAANKKKAASVCGKKAKYEKNGTCFCQIHAKTSGFLFTISQTAISKLAYCIISL